MRPLTAILCAGQGLYSLDGTERMRERPIFGLDCLALAGFHRAGIASVTVEPRNLAPGIARRNTVEQSHKERENYVPHQSPD